MRAFCQSSQSPMVVWGSRFGFKIKGPDSGLGVRVQHLIVMFEVRVRGWAMHWSMRALTKTEKQTSKCINNKLNNQWENKYTESRLQRRNCECWYRLSFDGNDGGHHMEHWRGACVMWTMESAPDHLSNRLPLHEGGNGSVLISVATQWLILVPDRIWFCVCVYVQSQQIKGSLKLATQAQTSSLLKEDTFPLTPSTTVTSATFLRLGRYAESLRVESIRARCSLVQIVGVSGLFCYYSTPCW